MGNTLSIISFTVVKSNPSGTIVRFTITDTANVLTMTKMIRAVLCDAIQQWIDAEAADLLANGNDALAVEGADLDGLPGQGFAAFDFNFGGKYAEIELVSATGISVTGNITATAPFADVA